MRRTWTGRSRGGLEAGFGLPLLPFNCPSSICRGRCKHTTRRRTDIDQVYRRRQDRGRRGAKGQSSTPHAHDAHAWPACDWRMLVAHTSVGGMCFSALLRASPLRVDQC
jgi:hypothetical protein